jgi:response regulator RpfG family c-di-GMP phosphodiesterase
LPADTIVGEQILAPVESLAGVHPLARHEHERWDGRGYPDGLAGEEIPLGALPREVAHDELRGYGGSHFDPRVVEALLAELAAAVTAA